MATTQMVEVTVQELTRYGFKANDKFVNYSKNLSETDKAMVVPGVTLKAEFYVADSGKEYLNKVLGASANRTTAPTPAAVTDVNPPVDTERAKKFIPKFTKKNIEPTSAGLTKEEWAMKDQRISRQGVIQAAVIALAPVVSLEQLPLEAKKLANSMLAFVNSQVEPTE
jgi:hypothetical protein